MAKKARLMVQELCKFGMSVVGISETKLFGSALYDIDAYLVLRSGCQVPAAGKRVKRNEGIRLVLDPVMAVSWSECGEV